MKTKILSILIGIGAFACGNLFAQRMPQDSWYLFKEFRGDIEGGKLYNPRFVAADASNNIYVADSANHRIQVFDSTGNFLRKWGSYGSNPGQMNSPWGICISSNKVYITEWDGDRVQVFDLQGNFLKAMGRNGSGDGQMTGAHDLAVDSSGNVYVADHELSRVMVFKSDGSYLRQWGSAGAADGQFQGLISICATPDGKIAAMERDGNRRVQVFDTNGVLQFKFGSSGDSPGQLNAPHGIRTDSAGNFYVSQHANRITVFNSSGTYVRVFGSGGSGNGQMNAPYGGGFAGGNIYVASVNNHRVEVFTTTGTWVRAFGSYGNRSFNTPWGITTDSSGNIFISSHSDHEIRKFDSNFGFLKRFGSFGSGNGQFNGSLDLAVGPNNRLYAVDYYNHRVQIFDLEGNFVGKFGVNGSGDGQFVYPWGIAVSTNRVYVADRDNHRIQIFDLNGNFIKKVGGLGSFGGQFRSPDSLALLSNGNLVVNDRGNWRVQVLDSEGNYLRKMPDGWSPQEVAASSDGMFYGCWGSNGWAFVDGNSLDRIRELGVSGLSWGPMCELKNGDLLVAGLDNAIRVLRRTFRTETPTTNNAIPLPVVISSSQRSGQKLLDLDYRVKDDDNSTVTTKVVAFNAGQNTLDDLILVKNFAEGTGANVGTNIPTGVTKRITWDIAKDWGSDFGQLQMEVLAKDNRDLLNLDFIQMPAVGGDPLLKISRTPLNDSDFLSVWYWLLANDDPGIKLTYGKVFPTNAATTFTYTGANGAPGLVGRYYPYTNFTGTPTVVTNQFINIRDRVSDQSPDTPIRWGNLSVRWTGKILPEVSGNYTISYNIAPVFFNGDSEWPQNFDNWYGNQTDSGRIFLNNATNPATTVSVKGDYDSFNYNGTWNNYTWCNGNIFTTNLVAGVAVPITIEYVDTGSRRQAQLYWTPPGGTRQLIPPKNLFTGVATTSGTYSYYDPDGTNWLANGTTTSAAGRTYIFDKMGYREATTAEVTRAKYAGTPGTLNQWNPKLRVGPDERPVKVNAYNFETGADGTWVVPK